MLLRFLSIGMFLGACAAVALPDTKNSGGMHRSDSHKIRLPCAPCSFADISCSQDTKPNAYLTVDFAMENGTLLANDRVVFPDSTSMKFPAVRHWDSSTSRETQDVMLEYALDAQQLPLRVDDVVGDDFRIRMRLFDLRGRPATPGLVTVGLVRNAEAKLLISHIQVKPAHHESHHHTKTWKMKFWKTQFGTHLVSVKEAVKSHFQDKSHLTSGAEHDSEQFFFLDSHRPDPSHEKPEQELGSPSSNGPPNDVSRFRVLSFYHFTHHGSPHRSHNQRHVMRLVRPIILPALLGILAGLVVCIIGFVLGRVFASACCDSQSRKSQQDVPVSVEEGEVSEKQQLVAILDSTEA